MSKRLDCECGGGRFYVDHTTDGLRFVCAGCGRVQRDTPEAGVTAVCRREECPFRATAPTHGQAVELGLAHDDATGHGPDVVVSPLGATLAEHGLADHEGLVVEGGGRRD